jgi:hypothetical protein
MHQIPANTVYNTLSNHRAENLGTVLTIAADLLTTQQELHHKELPIVELQVCSVAVREL